MIMIAATLISRSPSWMAVILRSSLIDRVRFTSFLVTNPTVIKVRSSPWSFWLSETDHHLHLPLLRLLHQPLHQLPPYPHHHQVRHLRPPYPLSFHHHQVRHLRPLYPLSFHHHQVRHLQPPYPLSFHHHQVHHLRPPSPLVHHLRLLSPLVLLHLEHQL